MKLRKEDEKNDQFLFIEDALAIIDGMVVLFRSEPRDYIIIQS